VVFGYDASWAYADDFFGFLKDNFDQGGVFVSLLGEFDSSLGGLDFVKVNYVAFRLRNHHMGNDDNVVWLDWGALLLG
jgi:hypothetical protein